MRRILAALREQVVPLWNEVAAYNREHRPAHTYKVTVSGWPPGASFPLPPRSIATLSFGPE